MIRLTRRPTGLGEPLGRYSHLAVGSGDLVAIAGQVGKDAHGRLSGPSLAVQARQAYANLGVALAATGCGYADVLKMTTYLVGAERVDEFMEARREIFSDLYPDSAYPPNTLLIVNRLVEPELVFEVEALAIVPSNAE